MSVECQQCQEAISASFDGEAMNVAAGDVECHLAGCPACRSWAASVEELHRASRVRTAETIPDQTSAILATAAARGLLSPDPGGSRRRCRVTLALVALLQLAIAVPDLLFGEESGATVHVAHEMGSWDLALAVGFLFAAWRPARAWGMVPLVTALVASLLVTTGLDVAEGHAELSREAVHILEVVGLGVLWALARRPPVARRPALRVA